MSSGSLRRSLLSPPQWAGRWAASKRSVLWILLLGLILALFGTLIWLAGRYEASRIQSALDRDAAETLTDIRSGLTRNIQGFQALLSGDPDPRSWQQPATQMLREHRELMQLEWRTPSLEVLSMASTPYRESAFARFGRAAYKVDVNLACTTARRLSGPAYSASYFIPQPDGLGFEVMDLCMPIMVSGNIAGYSVATYSLQDVLSELVSKQLARGLSVAFTEADGTRLALHGVPSRGSSVYISRQLLDLPGNTLVLRLENRRASPALFPNVLTALVTAMSLALMAVLFLLARDMRRRLRVENDLGEALAFRKAMEDSVLTGLRARDLSGHITYVNPAFCQMVGMEAKDLLNHSFPSPYWPPELAETYQQRQAIRLSGSNLPREGHESVFIRRDGTRFPVLIMEAPLINAVGKHTGWMSAILDVSEQRRVEELSRASQDRLQATARLAMIGEMASLLSHELNQPLAAISSYATGSLNLLKNQSAAGEPRTEGLPGGLVMLPRAEAANELSGDLQLAMSHIAAQAERAGKVIKSVHDFVRRRDQSREAVEPRALLDAVMPLVSLQARKLMVTVVIAVDPSCGRVVCDRTMVEQVLLNLSRNGMQAMQADSGRTAWPDLDRDARVLTLRVRPAVEGRHDWVEFAVIDRGEGVTPEVAGQLFTPFFTTKAEGMGLGLSLCRTVVEQHGGLLRFDPAQPRGTVFSFTLPADRTSGNSD